MEHPSEIKVDLRQAEAFLEATIGKDAIAAFQVFADPPDALVFPRWQYGRFKDVKHWLSGQNKMKAGVFVMVNQGDGEGREAKNVKAVTNVFIDLDGAPIEPVLASHSPPNIVVETSPGRYSAFWKVHGMTLEEFPAFQRALAEKFGSDPAVCDLPRVMRLPGFLHQKREPFLSRIHYQAEEIIEWNPQLLQSRQGLVIKTNGDRPKEIQVETDKEIFPEGQRHRKFLTVLARLRNSGLEGEALFQAAMIVNMERCRPPLEEKDVRRMAGNYSRKEVLSFDDVLNTSAPDLLVAKKADDTSGRTERPKKSTRIDFATLFDSPDVPTRWIIDDFLPVGLTVLAADPKSGKTLLALHLCLSVALGEMALGKFQANQGNILGFFLEDPEPRFKKRMKDMLSGVRPPEKVAEYSYKCPILPGTIEEIKFWYLETKNPSLVVIDTFEKIRGRPKFGESIYSHDYREVGSLQELAMELNIAIILIHHTNKGDSADEYKRISGSHGITGGSDSNWVLDTDKEIMEAKLTMVGREIKDCRYWLKFDDNTGRWDYVSTFADHHKNSNQQVVIEGLADLGTATIRQLARHVGRPVASTHRAIRQLVDSRVVTIKPPEGYCLTKGNES